jgi:histidine ammonia-lyase
MKEKYIPDNDYGLGLKVHEDAYREFECELASAKKQRDRLAEALDRIAVLHESKEMTGTVDQRIADAYDMRCIAREALAAVKGENNE